MLAETIERLVASIEFGRIVNKVVVAVLPDALEAFIECVKLQFVLGLLALLHEHAAVA